MSTQNITSEKNQYSLLQILGIWLAGGAPMWLLSWAAYPALSAGLPQMDAGLLRMKLFTVGLIWEFVLAMIILYREDLLSGFRGGGDLILPFVHWCGTSHP